VARAGDDAVVITAGPVMLGEAMAAAQALALEGHSVEVRSHPWLAEFDPAMLRELADRGVPVVVVEDHHRLGGLGEGLFAAAAVAGLALPAAAHLALGGPPVSGHRGEALEAMGVGRQAIARRLRALLAGGEARRAG
jgi:transketolase C-terminal domain/subunit